MEAPQFREINRKHNALDVMKFEQRTGELMFGIGSALAGKVNSFQVMTDDHFVHRRDRKENDIHNFFELNNGQIFHLRAYTRHMLDLDAIPTEQIFLTGYLKTSVSHTGGAHSLAQKWYPWDANQIADEIISQNPSLF